VCIHPQLSIAAIWNHLPTVRLQFQPLSLDLWCNIPAMMVLNCLMGPHNAHARIVDSGLGGSLPVDSVSFPNSNTIIHRQVFRLTCNCLKAVTGIKLYMYI